MSDFADDLGIQYSTDLSNTTILRSFHKLRRSKAVPKNRHHHEKIERTASRDLEAIARSAAVSKHH